MTTIRADLVDARWRWVGASPQAGLNCTGVLHLAGCPHFEGGGAQAREIGPGDVPVRRCTDCERRDQATATSPRLKPAFARRTKRQVLGPVVRTPHAE